jgi:hypothetical protein
MVRDPGGVGKSCGLRIVVSRESTVQAEGLGIRSGQVLNVPLAVQISHLIYLVGQRYGGELLEHSVDSVRVVGEDVYQIAVLKTYGIFCGSLWALRITVNNCLVKIAYPVRLSPKIVSAASSPD